MKPVHFSAVNKMLDAPPGSGVNALPVHTDGAQCVSCWSLDWPERVSALFTGRVWLVAQSGGTQPPVALVTGANAPIPRNQNR